MPRWEDDRLPPSASSRCFETKLMVFFSLPLSLSPLRPFGLAVWIRGRRVRWRGIVAARTGGLLLGLANLLIIQSARHGMEPTASPCWLGWDGLHLPIPLLPPPPMHDLGVAFGGAEPTDTSPAGLSTSLSQSHSTCMPIRCPQ